MPEHDEIEAPAATLPDVLRYATEMRDAFKREKQSAWKHPRNWGVFYVARDAEAAFAALAKSLRARGRWSWPAGGAGGS